MLPASRMKLGSFPRTHNHQFEAPSPAKTAAIWRLFSDAPSAACCKSPQLPHGSAHRAKHSTNQGRAERVLGTIAGDYHWHFEILPIVETRSKSYSIKEVYFNGIFPRRPPNICASSIPGNDRAS